MVPQFLILIVDDEPDSADLLGMLLELQFPSAAVCVAHGGEEALRFALQQTPDVAISDLEMPGMDGEAFADALRASPTKSVPLLIAISGNIGRLAAIRSKGTFDHQLSKPVDVDGLVLLLEQKIARSRTDAEG
jgi:CheY-like chemotaxis protein